MDRRFFQKKGPFTLQDLSNQTSCPLIRGNPSALIHGVKPMGEAGPHDLCAFYNKAYRSALGALKAGAIFVTTDLADEVAPDVAVLGTSSPREKMIEALELFYAPYEVQAGIHPTACVDKSAKIGGDCVIGPGAVVEENAVLGKGVKIGACTVVGRGVEIGDGSEIEAHVTLSNALIGKGVFIKTGARIGQKGFGFVIPEPGKKPVTQPQLGRVLIGEGAEIGANTTIDRGSLKDTIIGRYVRIDNLVQIAHNVQIGDGCVIVAQTGIAGSTSLEPGVILGGQVGVSGHLTLGKGVKVMAKSGVMRSAKAGEILAGIPAVHYKTYFRNQALSLRSKKKV